jgi:hypothetical protein
MLPERQWYSAAFGMMRILTTLTRPVIDWTPHRKSWFLDGLLKMFLRFERPFPIPLRTVDEQVIYEARTNPRGIVVMTVHMPLNFFVARALAEMDCPPDAVIAGKDWINHGTFPIWGKVNVLAGLGVDGNVLIKTRSILRRGGSVAAMIDTPLGTINANLLRLVGKIGARIVFALVELEATGDFAVRFHRPPQPFCSSNEGILENLEFLQHMKNNILNQSLQATPNCRFRIPEIGRELPNKKIISELDRGA